jgi:phospholipid/cholesterol/gamma-HCH transport system substrate-binding protein
MVTPVHRNEARKFVYGVATLAVLVVIGVIGSIAQVGGALPLKEYTYVKADVGDVGVLKPGKQVKQNGRLIGTVSAIDYRDGLARVTLRLSGHRDVYRDARLTVGHASALGRKYVALDPGTPKAGLLGNQVIPDAQTEDSSSIEDVLSVLDPKTREALRSSLAEVGGGLAGHGPDLHSVLQAAPDLLGDVDRVAGALTGPRADLPGVLEDAEVLASRFVGREQQLSGLLENADQTLAALSVDNGAPLAATVRSLPSTLRAAKGALDSLDAPLRDAEVALRTVEPGGRALGAATPDLRSFLRSSVKPLEKVPAIGKQAGPALDDLTRTLADARPLVPQVARAVSSADTLLFALSPYAADAGRFFSEHDLLSGTIDPGKKNYFAILLTSVGLFSVLGAPDPFIGFEPYPEPGKAWDDSVITGPGGR